MRSAITVCLVPEARSGPFVFHQDLELACAHASELGFAAIELFPPGAEDIDPRSLRQVLHRNRLDLAAVGSGAGWVARKLSLTSPDCTVRERALQFIAGLVDFAGAFGAPVILGSMQGRAEGPVTRDQALHWLAQALEQLGPRAHGYGVPFLLEPLNRYESNLLNTLADTTDFLQPLRTRNIRILADLFHMNIEEASLPQSIRRAGELIGHVHFADSNRLAMGAGHTDFLTVTEALREVGYKGYLSAEVFPKPTSEEAARRTMESFRRCFPAS
ncbi:MAG: sugar phosphate isomerase/epimerase [Verrucomicrobiales bacterium]|nr:sugar phosphate isomerase/epimerase [Verrucomicrobiales bacterium]